MIKYISIAALCLMMAGSIAEAKPLSRCMGCHSMTHKVKICTGLQGIYNAPAGHAKGVKYSKAFYQAKWFWDEDHLRKWMCDSKSAIKEFSGNDKAKTKMPNMHICDLEKQNKAIAALKSLTD